MRTPCWERPIFFWDVSIYLLLCRSWISRVWIWTCLYLDSKEVRGSLTLAERFLLHLRGRTSGKEELRSACSNERRQGVLAMVMERSTTKRPWGRKKWPRRFWSSCGVCCEVVLPHLLKGISVKSTLALKYRRTDDSSTKKQGSGKLCSRLAQSKIRNYSFGSRSQRRGWHPSWGLIATKFELNWKIRSRKYPYKRIK